MRLDPYGQYPREGLDVTRLSLESSKKLENVAYESYSKLFEILEVEKQTQAARDETVLDQPGLDFDAEFERRMHVAKEAIILRKQKLQEQTGKEDFAIPEKRKAFLQSIVRRSREKFGLSGINRFVTNVKAGIRSFLVSNKEQEQNGT